jgi:glutamate synthase (NADPH/NADH) small chain
MKRRDQFMTVARSSGAERHPSERVGDFSEYKTALTEAEASQQASRCMDCGTQFCHVGAVFDQVKIGCPVYNLIPEWNLLVSTDCGNLSKRFVPSPEE